MTVSRRTLLAAAAAGLAAACSADPKATVTETPGLAATDSGAALSSATATAVARPTWPSKDSIVAEYDGTPGTEWGLSVRGVVRRLSSTASGYCLTLDACGAAEATGSGSDVDTDVLELLRKLDVKATLFLNARWINHNQPLAQELADDPLFELANHGTRHVPLSVSGKDAYGQHGTADVGEVYDEITENAELLADLGVHTALFRPGTAFSDDTAVQVANALGHQVIGFSVNGDAGATYSARQVASVVRNTQAGDIIIGHMNRPGGHTAEGLAKALPELIDQGLQAGHLTGNIPVLPQASSQKPNDASRPITGATSP